MNGSKLIPFSSSPGLVLVSLRQTGGWGMGAGGGERRATLSTDLDFSIIAFSQAGHSTKPEADVGSQMWNQLRGGSPYGPSV